MLLESPELPRLNHEPNIRDYGILGIVLKPILNVPSLVIVNKISLVYSSNVAFEMIVRLRNSQGSSEAGACNNSLKLLHPQGRHRGATGTPQGRHKDATGTPQLSALGLWGPV